MKLGVYNLNVSKDDLNAAWKWWRSLSINEMKAYEAKYEKVYHATSEREIHQIWEAENKP